MIVSAVIDPSSFGQSGIVDSETKKEAKRFLEGILENGVLVDKARNSKSLLDQAIREAETLSAKLGQSILILLADIKKDWKKLVASVGELEQSLEDGNIEHQVVHLANTYRADVIVVPEDRKSVYFSLGVPTARVVAVRDVSESNYEHIRQANIQPDDTLNNLTDVQVEELIGRSVKYTATLEVFDYHMGTSDQSASRTFLPAIKKIAEIWEKYCVVLQQNPSARKLILYTAAERRMTGGTRTCHDVYQTLETKISTPLASNINASIESKPKRDSDQKMHARGYVAKKRAYMVDPGIDAFKNFVPTRETVLQQNRALESHYSMCRRLPDS